MATQKQTTTEQELIAKWNAGDYTAKGWVINTDGLTDAGREGLIASNKQKYPSISGHAKKPSHRKVPDRSKFPKVNDWPSVTGVVGNTWSAFVYTGVTMSAPADGQSGSGHAWGLGVGDMAFAGLMGFASWDTLKSASNDFYIAGDDEVSGGILIYLSIDNSPVGLVAAAAEGLDILIGFDGTFTWN